MYQLYFIRFEIDECLHQCFLKMLYLKLPDFFCQEVPEDSRCETKVNWDRKLFMHLSGHNQLPMMMMNNIFIDFQLLGFSLPNKLGRFLEQNYSQSQSISTSQLYVHAKS